MKKFLAILCISLFLSVSAFGAWNKDGSGSGTSNPSTVTATDASDTGAEYYIPFFSGLTGVQTIYTDAGIYYNPSTNTITISSVVSVNGVSVAGTSSGGQYVELKEDTDNGSNSSGWAIYGDLTVNTFYALPLAAPTADQTMVFTAPSNQTMSDGSTKSISVGTWVTHQKEIGWTIHDSDDDTAVADGKQAAAVPSSMNGMELQDFTCSVADLNSATGGTTTVVLRRVRAGTPQDMTSTGVTIDYDEYTASDEVVDTSYDDLATGDSLYPDINAVTTGAVQKGLSCTAVFQ